MSQWCYICEWNKPFDMPEEIIQACIDWNLVVFAGAWISTEKKWVMTFSFYEEVCNELWIDSTKSEYQFSELMSLLCKKPNWRRKLFSLIKERIDYCKSFWQLKNQVTSFHRELSQIYFLKNIITTNWDLFFEEICNAQSFVTAEDFSFYNFPWRKVFKIHWSLSNLSSIVATKEDYKKCYKNLNNWQIWADLKHFIWTKTIVFIWYSLSDEDFLRIYQFLVKESNWLTPHAYIVKPSPSIRKEIVKYPLTIIETDGVYFIHQLKETLIRWNYIFEPDIIDGFINWMYNAICEIHEIIAKEYLNSKNPNLLYTLMYQDWILDFMSRYFNLKWTWEYYSPDFLKSSIDNYESVRKDKIKIKKYTDIAYIDWYIHMFVILIFLGIKWKKDILDKFNPYYIFWDDTHYRSIDEFLKDSNNVFHKWAFTYAKKYIETLEDNIPQHTAFLY